MPPLLTLLHSLLLIRARSRLLRSRSFLGFHARLLKHVIARRHIQAVFSLLNLPPHRRVVLEERVDTHRHLLIFQLNRLYSILMYIQVPLCESRIS